jgi:hypothetical protein
MLDEPLIIVLRDRKHTTAERSVDVDAIVPPLPYAFQYRLASWLIVLPNYMTMLEPNSGPNVVMQAWRGLALLRQCLR